MATAWALLIGIDCYIWGEERSVRYRNLNGCVNDVKAVEEYLGAIGVRNVTVLTSSGRPGSDRPIEEGTPKLPIYGNVKRELERIIDKASAGDLVYIHYSGHGIRRQALGLSMGPHFAGDEINGIALALADVMAGGAYLTGYHLGVFAREMVRKGLRPTLVLDSCFSGQGIRNSASTSAMNSSSRTVDGRNDLSVLEIDEEANAEAAKMDPDIERLCYRNATVRPSWLANPTGCTVLAACEFNESALEETLPGTTSTHGIFTFRMLEILKQTLSQRRPTHASVRGYVKSKFDSLSKKQSPVLHGDGDYVFFGKERVVERPICRILRKIDGQVELDVGYAQGVVNGAIYNVYQEDQLPGWESLHPPTATVIEALKESPFRSRARLSGNNVDAPGHTYGPPETDPGHEPKEVSGGSAVLSSWAVPYTVVRTFRTAQETSEAQVAALRNELAAHYPSEFDLTDHENETEPSPTFAVDLDKNKMFRVYILDNTSKSWNRGQRIPNVSVENNNWVKDLISVLRHLSRFRSIKDIRNESSHTRLSPSCLEVTVQTLTGVRQCIEVPRGSDGKYRATHGAQVRCIFKPSKEYINSRGEDLYVSFYMFSATWGISKLHPALGQPALLLTTKGEHFTLTMHVPPPRSKEDPDEIEDIVRAFICNTNRSWEDITLPDLPAEAFITPLQAETEILVATPAHADRNGVICHRTDSWDEDELEEKWGFADIVLRTSPTRRAV
ncbi:hypothetical protein Dda_4043 [Drechslerella dactyloides]|uniref:Peptidase C14 caspase domain-containing protein n=1 Tax=Drechslerella dactyloides TaxID=74499 RepID=A0AAD6IZ05_DREDA|nr:hypothetical protein Dda_4043 [Drechslerella dactyloides]